MYKITNIEDFIESCRLMVYHYFGAGDEADVYDGPKLITIDMLSDEEKSEIDSCLNKEEAFLIFKEHAKIKYHKTKNKNEYYLSNTSFMQYIEALNTRMVSNILSNLVKRGVVESTFDEDSNDFVFWVNNKDEQN
jgi:hypothetical protein